jgi:hypothetical protein
MPGTCSVPRKAQCPTLLAAWLLVLLAFATAWADGAEAPANPDPPMESPSSEGAPEVPAVPADAGQPATLGVEAEDTPDDDGFVDRAHAAVSRGVIAANRRLDAFFADERFEEEVYGTRLRVTGGLEVRSDGEVRALEEIDAKVAMPGTERRLELLVSNFELAEDAEDDGRFRRNEDASQLATGLRYNALGTATTYLPADGGLRIRPMPDPFVRLRGRILRSVGSWDLRLTQSIFWFLDEGLGESTRLDFDRPFDDDTALRISTRATFSESTDGFEWRQTLQLRRALSARRAIAIEALAEGPTDPHFFVETYAAVFRYRQRVWRDWLWIEIAPGVLFPRERDYEVTPAIGLSVDVIFGSWRVPK